MNRLSAEKSPYLLSHSRHPVDWYPWGKEAFDKAESENMPIFLSVGYSACHWCHVIARESFEDKEVAEALNKNFIAVKVDKEERPDVDAVYMDAVQLSTGGGGWPMTLLLTPSGAPFYAATYLPKKALLTLLARAAEQWQSDRAAAERAGEELKTRMRAAADVAASPHKPDDALTRRALKAYQNAYDPVWGGFGRAPKFPAAHSLLFLLRHYERTGDESALSMAGGTLDAMYRGGLFDHVGGGFCRYSVDEKWLVPHFEKMLYDNALLLWAYAYAWRVTGKAAYRAVARRTADFVLRELTGPEGAFYSSLDADAQGREGAYYLFTPEEILSLLGEEDGGRFCRLYGITKEGNFEGKSIPNLIGAPDQANADAARADEARVSEAQSDAADALRGRVLSYRAARMPLSRDDKVLLSWNALMICALCEASRALDEPAYYAAARRADDFIRRNMTGDEGTLLLRWRDGEGKGRGVLADYAYYALALTALYDCSGEEDDLKNAGRIASHILQRFADQEKGGFFLYDKMGEQLLTRPKDVWDGAMPSGNACAALAFLRLKDNEQKEPAHEQLCYLAGLIAGHPTGHGFALYAVEEALAWEDAAKRG